MAANIKVVLFEDTATTQSQILEAVRGHFAGDGDVVAFDGTRFAEPNADQRMYEDRLVEALGSAPYDGSTLVVADRDLSKSPYFGGLSVSAVAAASKRLSLPICSYASHPALDDYGWGGQWEEGHIVLSLSEGVEELARQAVIAARGFAALAEKLPAAMQDKSNKSPAKMLAALLGKSEYVGKIALYGTGDQSRLTEIPPEAKLGEEQVQKMARFLGYWLWNSLMLYPGLLVNEVAAASYLNIATTDFSAPEVRRTFEEALYRGPFEDSKRPQWWRGMLDDIVSRESCADGLELVRKQVHLEVNPSQCCEDPSKPAGYYCIISRQPVSLENSKGGLSWFPRGADLTRIRKSKFDEYGPWLGI